MKGEAEVYISDYIQETDNRPKAHYLNWKLLLLDASKNGTQISSTPHPSLLVNLEYHLVGLSNNLRTTD